MTIVTNTKTISNVASSTTNDIFKDKDLLLKYDGNQHCGTGEYQNAIKDAFDAGFNAGLLSLRNEIAQSSTDSGKHLPPSTSKDHSFWTPEPSKSKVDPFFDPDVSISDLLWKVPVTPTEAVMISSIVFDAKNAIAEASVNLETINDAYPLISTPSDAPLPAENETSNLTPDNYGIESDFSMADRLNFISSDTDPTSAWNTNNPNYTSHGVFGLSSNYDSSGSQYSSTEASDI